MRSYPRSIDVDQRIQTTDAPARVAPDRTTLWGGAALAVAGLVGVLGVIDVEIPISSTYSLTFVSLIPQVVGAVVELIAFAILALGLRGERRIVGCSRPGQIALVVFGVSRVAAYAVGESFAGAVINELLSATALVVAAVIVARSGVLHGVARWGLVAVAAARALATIGFYVVPPSIPTNWIWVIFAIGDLIPIGLLVTGIAYILHGRSAAIRHRLQIINEKW